MAVRKLTPRKLSELADTSDVDLATVRYAEELRAIGQALEALKFTSVAVVELEVEGDGYRVRAEVDQSEKADVSFAAITKKFVLSFGFLLQTKKQPTARSIELRYGPREIQKMIQEGASRRLDIHAVPDHFSLSHILRQAGAYVDDFYHATLARVIVKGRWITICYKDSCGQIKELKQDLQFFYDYWVKMYLRRSDRPVPRLSTRATYVTRT